MLRYPRLTRLRKQLALKPPGSPPGMLVADPSSPKPVVGFLAFGGGETIEHDHASLDDVRGALGARAVLWVNVDGLGDAEVVRGLGEMFGLHPLALEDVLSGLQRAKVEHYDGNVFVVLREPRRAAPFESDQISMFLGKNFVVTFQEHAGDCFGPVRQRIRASRGKVCTHGPDYLAYSLIDAMVDAYFPVLEAFGERLERIEDEAVECPSRSTSREIHQTKRELLVIRRAIWPAREALSVLIRDEEDFIGDEARLHLRDCYDHVVQLIEVLENYREIGSDLMDVYLSSVSNRLNEIMKVLAIISTIFLPLSFIAGVYGMNFEGMPELHLKYGYAFSLGLMGAVAVVMLIYFRSKGWLGENAARRKAMRLIEDRARQDDAPAYRPNGAVLPPEPVPANDPAGEHPLAEAARRS